jgi:chemotaxis protein MotB
MNQEEQIAHKHPEIKGSPAWVVTFADLMSLLMAFFVLLLSFSQMDVQKFKKLAGSMEHAFGVQKNIVTYEIPKGTSVIAKEFTPGTPDPSSAPSLYQKTMRDMFQTLEFDKANEKSKLQKQSSGSDQRMSAQDTASVLAALKKLNPNIDKGTPDDNKISDEVLLAIVALLKEAEDQVTPDLIKEALRRAHEKAQALMQVSEIEAIKTASNVSELLKKEIAAGMVEVEIWDMHVVIRLADYAVFREGDARIKRSFVPVLDRLRQVFSKLQGTIEITGHTDDLPEYTEQFRSNWDLSAARAATVAHELLMDETLDPARIKVVGLAGSSPRYPNDSEANRRKNRRVEIMLIQSDEPVYSQEVVQELKNLMLDDSTNMTSENPASNESTVP